MRTYSDGYEATRLIWTDLWNGRIVGLIYVVCSHRGCCGWSFNYDGLGRNKDATVSLCGLSRTTPVSGVVYMYIYLIYEILILKFYSYYVFNIYMYYRKEHRWSLESS